MKQQKTITIPTNDLLAKQISGIARQEGHTFEKMVQILLEDALALRKTIKAQGSNHNHAKKQTSRKDR